MLASFSEKGTIRRNEYVILYPSRGQSMNAHFFFTRRQSAEFSNNFCVARVNIRSMITLAVINKTYRFGYLREIEVEDLIFCS